MRMLLLFTVRLGSLTSGAAHSDEPRDSRTAGDGSRSSRTRARSLYRDLHEHLELAIQQAYFQYLP